MDDKTMLEQECDGACEEHHGPVLLTLVVDESGGLEWQFYYCDAARAIDVGRGFSVTVAAAEIGKGRGGGGVMPYNPCEECGGKPEWRMGCLRCSNRACHESAKGYLPADWNKVNNGEVRMHKFTPEQKKWVKEFERETGGFDVITAEFEAGRQSFTQCAEYNIQLYRDHAEEAADRMQRMLDEATEKVAR